MRYENLGPVANADGSPSDLTRSMLAGTGRSPEAFAMSATHVTVTFIPNGWSEPQEKQVVGDGYADLDSLVDGAVADSWDCGDEPIEVRSMTGRVLWQNSRY